LKYGGRQPAQQSLQNSAGPGQHRDAVPISHRGLSGKRQHGRLAPGRSRSVTGRFHHFLHGGQHASSRRLTAPATISQEYPGRNRQGSTSSRRRRKNEIQARLISTLPRVQVPLLQPSPRGMPRPAACKSAVSKRAGSDKWRTTTIPHHFYKDTKRNSRLTCLSSRG